MNTLSSPTSTIQSFGQWVSLGESISPADWAFYPAVSTIQGDIGQVSSMTISSINGLPASAYENQSTIQFLDATTISTATILGANSNLFNLGIQGLEIRTAPTGQVWISSPQTNIAGLTNASTVNAFLHGGRAVEVSSITTSTIRMQQQGPFLLSSLMGLSTSIVAGSGSSTITTLNTDLSLGNNLLWARQARLGFGNTNENISEVLMYGGGGDFRVLKSGQGDTTVRVGTNISGNNTGYLLDTLLNTPFFSTINSTSTAMMCYFPSSLTSTIGISTLSYIPSKAVIGGFHSISTQELAINTPLVLWNEATDVAVGGITTSTNAIVIPSAGNYEINTSIQFSKTGGSGTADIWFRLNGTDIPNSASEVYLPTSGLGQALGNVSFIQHFSAGDKIQVIAASPDAGVSATFFQSTVTTPYTRPAVPSLITSVKNLNY
jgi:hypothetical protein